jgi:hypothetical protein
MVRLSLLWLVPLVMLHAQEVLSIGEDGFRVKQGERIVIDTNLRCRANPSLNSVISGRLPLGEQVTSQFATTAEVLVGNVMWYRIKGTQCWIYGPATFLWNTSDREPVAFAILDRLTKKDVRFEDFMEAEKVMVDTFGWKLDGQDAHVSARLRFKILQMLDTAASFKDAFSPAFRSWQDLHGSLLRNAPEPDQSAVTVPSDEYWKLFEANRNEPWADDVAWSASSWGPYSDECGSGCQFYWIGQREAQYWKKLPRGRHIGEALASANTAAADLAKTACDSPFDSIGHMDILAMRDSLSRVTHPAKQELIKALDEIARKCPN